MQRAEKDRMSDFATWTDLEALKRNLQFTKDDLLKKQEQASSVDDKMQARDEISSELERMSLLSEDISKRLKAQELASTAQDLARSQSGSWSRWRNCRAATRTSSSIMKQISELAKTLASLQQALSQFAQQMPDDFMNMESMQGLGFNEMFSALEEIRKKLMQGDIEGARQRLGAIQSNGLDGSVLAERAALGHGLEHGSHARRNGALSRQLQEIAREQQEILMPRPRGQQVGPQRAGCRPQGKARPFLEKAKNELGQLTELFPDREGPDDPSVLENLDDATMNQLLKNLIAKLLSKDFPGYAQGDELAKKELAKKRTHPGAKGAPGREQPEKFKGNSDALMGEPAQALKIPIRKTCGT